MTHPSPLQFPVLQPLDVDDAEELYAAVTDALLWGNVHPTTALQRDRLARAKGLALRVVSVTRAQAHATRTEAPEDTTQAEPTWTFLGHWDGDALVIEHAVPGVHDDVWDDDGTHDGGLFAASASGRTLEDAEANLRAEYEPCPECGADADDRENGRCTECGYLVVPR